MSHREAGIPQLDTVHNSSSHTVSLTFCVRGCRYGLNILQRNVSLTLLTYVEVTMRGTSLLLDNHWIRTGEGWDVLVLNRAWAHASREGWKEICWKTPLDTERTVCTLWLLASDAEINGVKPSNVPLTFQFVMCNLPSGFHGSVLLSWCEFKDCSQTVVEVPGEEGNNWGLVYCVTAFKAIFQVGCVITCNNKYSENTIQRVWRRFNYTVYGGNQVFIH